jgi:hypothetical protein
MHKETLSSNTRTLYEQTDFPILQNKVYHSAEDALNCPLGDIKIIQDFSSGLIYNAAFRPELAIYDKNYNNEQGNSNVFKAHLNWVAKIIASQLGGNNLIEVGCGKGFFLELMLGNGFDIIGFDSTYDGDNPRIVKKYFEPGIIKSPANGLILRHVLEHIPDPIDFLFQLCEANAGRGLIYIEVPCFDWIMKNRTWFDIFYEHVNYFRIDDFFRMFGRIVESGYCFGGQYLYVIADLSTLRTPIFKSSCEFDFPKDFLDGLAADKNQSNDFARQKQQVAVWGGASKGVIFSLLRQRIGLTVDMVIDVNQGKQGKFLPATGLRVYSPAEALTKLEAGSCVYVMNSNYMEEIKKMSNFSFNYIGVDQ